MNRHLSKIEDGIAIYDYVDLPAYFNASEVNIMSPKYPVSVTFSYTSVIFRLHYCAYKIEGKKENFENYTDYKYDSGDLRIENEDNYKSGDAIKVAHMEEIILELPFIENTTSILSDIIKDIYITNFPQMIGGGASTGGRFLEQLIHKRYPKSSEWKSVERLEKDGDVEALLYGTLREASDDSPSYSTLWLMDLIKDVEGEKDKKRIDLYNQKDGSVVAFLRKLLLDFMFDLKHSDVFQNSSCYQKMYSGLMSDFYFSALMHKCEYYYCRELTRSAVEKNGSDDATDRIKTLYAEELFKAEELWIQDIMSPQAEKLFSHSRYKKDVINKNIREVIELVDFVNWPSWFAEPEEEMRRVCFKMIDDTGESHICNTDTLVEYLKLEFAEDERSKRMVLTRNRNREEISKWFLKRYDFNDLFHLHLFRHSNILLLCSTLYVLWLFLTEDKIILNNNDLANYCSSLKLPITIFAISLSVIIVYRVWRYGIIRWGKDSKWKKLVVAKHDVVLKRIIMWAYIMFALTMVFVFKDYRWSIAVLALLFLVLIRPVANMPRLNIPSKLHLTFPRLVAAITAAWFAMSMGFDIYVSFFDQLPEWYTASAISIIVFGFIMYEINRIMPSCCSLRKIYRSFEFLVISYCISLLVGVVVINFVGEKFLERGGAMDEYYKEYVNGNRDWLWNKSLDYTYFDKANIDINSTHDKVNALTKIKHQGKDEFIMQKPTILNTQHDIFIMRDFLIMFSFIAMFWGIFISMIFTGEKQMTEL